MQKAVADQSFNRLATEVQTTTRQFFLDQLLSLDVFSIWHFLGEPCAKGALFSCESGNGGFLTRETQSFRKRFGSKSLVEMLVRAEERRKALPVDKPAPPPAKVESKLKALHDPAAQRISPEEQECSPKKRLTDWLEATPDYLNFHPGSAKNVLIDLRHLISEEIVAQLQRPGSMISLLQLLETPERPSAETFFRSVASPQLSAVALKMHLVSLVLSKGNRAAFGFSRLDIDPQVGTSPG